jgi:hypothetical protein
MRINFGPTLIALIALTLAAPSFTACGEKKQSGAIPTLDLEAAIDNPRTFDLAEIAASVEFIPLDDSTPQALVGNIRAVTDINDRFYVQDNGQEYLFKIFDRQGRFISTMGRIGRGPGEFMFGNSMTPDPEGDVLYMTGRTDDGKVPIVAFDATGRVVARNDSIQHISGMAFFDGRLFVMKASPAPVDFGDSPNFVSSVGTRVPLLEIYSPDLRLEKTVETIDKGDGSIVTQMEMEGRSGIMVLFGGNDIISNNGNDLILKEARSDTLFYFRNGTLTPGLLVDLGKYAMPADAFGINPTVKAEDRYTVSNIFDGGDYFIIPTPRPTGGGVAQLIIINRNAPAEGFSATGGPENKPGLWLDGLRFTPMYAREGGLVGYLNALDIVDNAEAITNPDLKALAATLKEESNPVIVIVELK